MAPVTEIYGNCSRMTESACDAAFSTLLPGSSTCHVPQIMPSLLYVAIVKDEADRPVLPQMRLGTV